MAISGAHLQMGSESVPALAFFELSSISRGLFLTDAALKKAPVRVVASQPVSSGKHALLISGDVASVEEASRTILEQADGTLLRHVLIPSVHAQLAPFVDSLWRSDAFTAPPLEAVGMVESLTLAGAILSADRALKAARVALCRLRLGQGIGGKAYFVLTGRQDEVEAALDAARASLAELESLCRVDLIPRPLEEALAHF